MPRTLDDGQLASFLKGHKGEELIGVMEEVTLPELVQLACLEGKARAIRLIRNDASGTIYCSQGEVVHAEAGGKTGTDAFFDLMLWDGAIFSYYKDEPPANSISAPWNFLLIEASRLIDERNKQRAKAREEESVKVLIVDDSDLTCKILKKELSERFDIQQVYAASNGKEALSMLKRLNPDLVTLDMNMPVMGGDIAFKHIMIRSPAPVVLVSGMDSKAMPRILEFLRLGAIDFLPKPSPADGYDAVVERIGRYARRARRLKVMNARRAKKYPPARRKLSLRGTPDGIAIFAGGPGGLLEVLKIIPQIPPAEGIALLFILDVMERVVPPLADELNKMSTYHVVPASQQETLEGGICILSSLATPVELCKDEECLRLRPCSGDKDTISAVVESAAELFGVSCAIFAMSGAYIPESCLDVLVSKGGRMLIQDPKTCIDTEAIERLQELEMEDGIFEPEAISGPMNAWLSAFRHVLAQQGEEFENRPTAN